ncbi:hypothetical protein NLI96_g3646 [Meripilus lineatus]|uniref:chitinase n=1 Tax=Meripilus lineatus TaxID=2056292 RepID=A0AAD5V7W7_9APHY|nr:hypothetical protein NLI96_g3646 [Physisporinus lineatus]
MALTSNFRRILFLATVVAFAVVGSNATQVMHRPDTYLDAPRNNTIGRPTPKIIHKRAGTKVQSAYFTNWGIYGRNFQPSDIIPEDLTHILYSFADVSPDTGVIAMTDSWADEQKHYPGDSWSEPGNNLYGCLKQLYLMKMANRNLKVQLSVGGWTYSQAGHFNFVTDSSKRAAFVQSALKLIEDYGFDGIDLDFEYPSTPQLGQGFADLLSSLRTALDLFAKTKGDTVPYLLTAAVPAGAANYANLVVPQMNAALDYWNLMAYDYAGSWLTYADHQANLYGGERTGVSTDAAVKFYVANGASAGKITMGLPLYGRAFENTNGIGQSYNGIGPGTFEAGVYNYNALPIAGAQVFENTTDVTSYSYDSAKKELVSYDDPHIAQLKAQYIVEKGLAGAMFWELSSDKKGADSLVGTTSNVFGNLDQTQNHLNYPGSKWDNIRNKMGGGTTPSSSSTNPPGTTPTPTSPSTSPTATPTGGSGQCSGVSAWSASATYTGGMTATYGGHLWTAKWWTLGDTPGGSAGVWTDNGAC